MSYGRPAQSKAQNESNAKILRALVKQPDNKVCVDCKRNDPRWASWNLGCFLCIRCSGIHRSMGTHISKVKSIDLDIWTPEQMASVQRWGNRRANLYWEAHLKQGHVPPDHKVESFIRSKYELRRWAKDGPLPSDPATLDGGDSVPTVTSDSAKASSSATPTASASAARPAAKANVLDLLGGGDVAPAAATTSVSKPSGANLLDDFDAPSAPVATQSAPQRTPSVSAAPTQAAQKPMGAGGGLFDLDWQDGASAAATSATSPRLSGGGGKTGSKSDILSLYANARPVAPVSPTSPQQGGMANLNASFGGMNMGLSGPASSAAAPPPTSNPWSPNVNITPLGNTSSAFAGASDPWASTTSGSAAFTGGSDIWGNATTMPSANNGFSSGATKKNDAFDDIWSDFK